MICWIHLLVLCCGFIHLSYCQCEPGFIVNENGLREGDTVETECVVQNRGTCPGIHESITYERYLPDNNTWEVVLRWTKGSSDPTFLEIDGYSLDGRVTYDYFNEIYYIDVTDSSIQDSGQWRCSVRDGGNVDNYSQIKQISLTNGAVDSSNIRIHRLEEGDFVVNATYQFQCVMEGVYPENVKVSWYIGNREYSGRIDTVRNGFVFNIINTAYLRVSELDQTEVICKIDKEDEPTWDTENNWIVPNEKKYPAFIEDLKDTQSKIQQGFEIGCIASGDNVTFTWTINGEAWKDIHYLEEIDNVNGKFEYNQTTALESRLVLIQNDICGNTKDLSGTYLCKTTGLSGTQSTRSIDIDTDCGAFPIWAIVLITILSIALIASAIGGMYYYYKKQHGTIK